MRKEVDKVKIDGAKLHLLRQQKGLSQKALEGLTKKLGSRVSERTISRIENGGDAQLGKIRILAQALGVEIEALCVSKGGQKRKTLSRPALNKYLQDFSDFINNRTKDFIGRDFVFDKIDAFIAGNDSGYFFIKGDPGIGKSAIAAELVSRCGYIHHFNIRAEGINKARQFLENVCAQLILNHKLDYDVLPTEKWQDSKLLGTLLREVSAKIKPSEKVIIIIDALDEVDGAAMASDASLLYLPMNLPEGIFVVATTRPDKLNLRIDCAQDECKIVPGSDENREDIGEHLKARAKDEGIRLYIKKQKLTQKDFVEHMKDKSEGNFMYLHYVLPEIETGAYKDLQLNHLPKGLNNYYDDHWRRMRMTDKDRLKSKIKIIYTLSEAKQPISCNLLTDFTKEDRITVQDVVDEWIQFLHKQEIKGQKIYSFYHNSFRDFLNRKDIIQAAGIDIGDINDNIMSPYFE